MVKQAILEREKKRKILVLKYRQKRIDLVNEFLSMNTLEKKFLTHKKIEKLPRNSSYVRLRNRCWKTGRGRGIHRDFGLCRHMLKDLANQGFLPGVHKASW
jgi:small subunit ribosomal protein S14